jgi:putative chitinase
MIAAIVYPSIAMFEKLWPHGDQHIAGLIEGIVTAAPRVFPKYGFASTTAVAMALAQFSEECGAGLEMLENFDYTAERLREVFPTHFTSMSMALHYAHNPRAAADIAYGGRMGNDKPPSDDGYNFRGAGLSQVTGRNGVAAAQKVLDAHKAGFSILTDPALIIDPEHTLECGVADFVACGCLPYAEKNDIIRVTERLNGGLIGLADRRAWLPKWRSELENPR